MGYLEGESLVLGVDAVQLGLELFLHVLDYLVVVLRLVLVGTLEETGPGGVHTGLLVLYLFLELRHFLLQHLDVLVLLVYLLGLEHTLLPRLAQDLLYFGTLLSVQVEQVGGQGGLQFFHRRYLSDLAAVASGGQSLFLGLVVGDGVESGGAGEEFFVSL